MWGSTQADDILDPCTTCPNCPACVQAVHALAPVRCELPSHEPSGPTPGEGSGIQAAQPARYRPPRGRKPRNYAAHIRPGETITAQELAARAGGAPKIAANWLAAMVARGRVTYAGRIIPGPGNTAWAALYRLNQPIT